jgi:hypothetical protein
MQKASKQGGKQANIPRDRAKKRKVERVKQQQKSYGVKRHDKCAGKLTIGLQCRRCSTVYILKYNWQAYPSTCSKEKKADGNNQCERIFPNLIFFILRRWQEIRVKRQLVAKLSVAADYAADSKLAKSARSAPPRRRPAAIAARHSPLYSSAGR